MATETIKEELERQYWDSCLFIDFIGDRSTTGSARSKTFIQLVKDARAGRAIILLSTLILAEIRPKHAKNGQHRKLLEELLDASRPFVQFFGVTRRIALKARDVGARHSLSVADAVHVATALIGNAAVLFTYDGYSEGKPMTKLLALDRQIEGLRIEVPHIRVGPLFDHK